MSKTPASPQAKRLASLIAANDGREGSRVSAERFQEMNIEASEISDDECDYLSSKIEEATGDNGDGLSEKLFLSRLIAEGTGTRGENHFHFVVARCYKNLAIIAKHYSGDYEDYPVINVHDIYKMNLKPKSKWGSRLDSSVYDRMASLLVALYLEKALSLGDSCVMRIDVHREVIEPLVANEALIIPNLEGIFELLRLADESIPYPLNLVQKKHRALNVHEVIKLASMMNANEKNLERMIFIVKQRGLNIGALEAFLTPEPALTGGVL
jgi:hypothetical protein